MSKMASYERVTSTAAEHLQCDMVTFFGLFGILTYLLCLLFGYLVLL